MTNSTISATPSVIEERPPTVAHMFFERVRATPESEAYRFPRGEQWESMPWREAGDRVTRLAAGLISLGIEPEQRIGIASSTRVEWILADMAILCAGAATTTVYPSTVPPDVAYILADSECRVVFAEDATQVAKLHEHRAELPYVDRVVVFDGPTDDDWLIGLEELEALGAQLLAADPDVVQRRVDAISPNSLATLIYTSGTTGRPKGVRLRHSSWTYEGTAIQALDILTPDDVQFLWLPLAHSFGKVLLTAQLGIGFATAVDGRPEKIVENCGVVRPTFMGAAPRIFEKAHDKIVLMQKAEGGIKEKLFKRAFAVGLEVDRRRREGRPVPFMLARQHALFDKLVFAKIRERFGGRVRFFISGAAALNRDVAEWFGAAGLLILEGYGLTETSAGSFVNRPTTNSFGTVGPPLPGTAVRIADDGEVLISGPGVMDGYHNLPEETAASLTEDGWLRTGDIGELDESGRLRITDRKKDLFKTSGGKYVAPTQIESQFKAICPYVGEFLVHGHERNYCVALVTLDPEAMAQWAEQNGMAGRPYPELVATPEVQAMVGGYIDELNARLNRWETIKSWALLENDLSVAGGELTPSLKVKRNLVENRYKEKIDALYSEPSRPSS